MHMIILTDMMTVVLMEFHHVEIWFTSGSGPYRIRFTWSAGLFIEQLFLASMLATLTEQGFWQA